MNPPILRSSIIPSPIRRHRSNPQGFALILVLALMALIMMLLAGVLSLASSSQRTSSSHLDDTKARQNALLAMRVALGELQKSAGADQRSTAAADLAGAGEGARLINGSAPENSQSINGVNNGLRSVHPGTRYWTGVWGNADTTETVEGNGNIYEKTPSPKLLGWLVSGNEDSTFTTSASAPNFGQVISEGQNVNFTPASVVSGIDSATRATSPLTITDSNGSARDAVLLLGSGSASEIPRTLADGSVENPEDRYVAAPLVTITSNASESGHYAFWVSDEGVKARLDLVDPYAEQSDTSTTPEARYRLMTAPRTGLEILPPFAATPYLGWSQYTGGGNSPLAKIFTYPEVPLIDEANLTGAGGDPVAITGPLFHALTTYSSGVLSDSLNGGLKRDLTAAFNVENAGNWNSWSGSNASWTGTDRRPAGAGQPIIPPAYSPTLKGLKYGSDLHPNYSHPAGAMVPRWDVLYDFHNLFNQTEDSGAVPARAADVDELGLAPQILQLRMLLGADATEGRNIRFLFTPMIVVGNPYGVPMKLENLKLRFWLARNPGPFGKRWPNGVKDCISNYNFSRSASARAYSDGNTAVLSVKSLTESANAWPPSTTGDVDFSIPTTVIEPGKTKVFSLSETFEYSTGQPIPLTEGEIATYASAYNYLWKDSGQASPPYTESGGPTYFGTVTELDIYTPMLVEILDENNKVVQEIETLNIDVGTNTYGVLRSPTGATAKPNSDDGAKLIAAYYFDQTTPGNFFDLSNNSDNSVRPYADFNPRASYIRHTNKMEWSGESRRNYFAGLNYRDSSTSSEIATANGTSPAYPPPSFTSNLDPVLWGRVDKRPPVNTLPQDPIFFDLPSGETPVLSLGDLQQANITADDIRVNVGHQPANAIGNAYATPFVRRELVKQERTDQYSSRHGGGSYVDAHEIQTNYYDISYLLNSALWDSYYFSGTPSASKFTPNNPRLELQNGATETAARDIEEAATQTVIDGGFNINSTSVDAWAALLAGMRNLPGLPSGASAAEDTTIFPRSLSQTEDASETPSGNERDTYSGFRSLTDDQVNELAEAIVKQVRLRGPFVSLSHFVNRALVPATDDTRKLGFAGALQTAIDMTSINDFSNVPKDSQDPSLSDQLTLEPGDNDAYNYYAYNDPPYSDASIFTENAVRAQRSTGIPGWLSQADVLKAIGSVISSRSDTFVIRSYGDTVNPSTGKIVARAWCEAVVQRLPEYIDPSVDSASTSPLDATEINKAFGRRFKIISFRWLSPDEV